MLFVQFEYAELMLLELLYMNSRVLCIFGSVANFASSTAVLCNEVVKWVTLSTVLKILFPLRGVCMKLVSKRNLPQADLIVIVS